MKRVLTCAFSCALWAVLAACEGGASGGARTARVFTGALAPAAGLPFAVGGQPALAVLYLTPGGHFGSSLVDGTGVFTLPVPVLESTGALVLADIRADPTKAVVLASLAQAGTGNGLLRIPAGEEDAVLSSLLVVDTGAGTMTFGEVPPEIVFVSGPYSAGMLCSDDLEANCPLSDALSCDPGPCLPAVPAGEVASECDPCGALPNYTGPFLPAVFQFTSNSVDKTPDPLPDLVAPYPGFALTGLQFEIPPAAIGGITYPAVSLDLGRIQPGFFLTALGDYRFVFGDGARLSADDLLDLNLPDIPTGSLEKIVVRYRTTLGTITTYRCAAGNPDPEC